MTICENWTPWKFPTRRYHSQCMVNYLGVNGWHQRNWEYKSTIILGKLHGDKLIVTCWIGQSREYWILIIIIITIKWCIIGPSSIKISHKKWVSLYLPQYQWYWQLNSNLQICCCCCYHDVISTLIWKQTALCDYLKVIYPSGYVGSVQRFDLWSGFRAWTFTATGDNPTL